MRPGVRVGAGVGRRRPSRPGVLSRPGRQPSAARTTAIVSFCRFRTNPIASATFALAAFGSSANPTTIRVSFAASTGPSRSNSQSPEADVLPHEPLARLLLEPQVDRRDPVAHRHDRRVHVHAQQPDRPDVGTQRLVGVPERLPPHHPLLDVARQRVHQLLLADRHLRHVLRADEHLQTGLADERGDRLADRLVVLRLQPLVGLLPLDLVAPRRAAGQRPPGGVPPPRDGDQELPLLQPARLEELAGLLVVPQVHGERPVRAELHDRAGHPVGLRPAPGTRCRGRRRTSPGVRSFLWASSAPPKVIPYTPNGLPVRFSNAARSFAATSDGPDEWRKKSAHRIASSSSFTFVSAVGVDRALDHLHLREPLRQHGGGVGGVGRRTPRRPPRPRGRVVPGGAAPRGCGRCPRC